MLKWLLIGVAAWAIYIVASLAATVGSDVV
jgi:hypothetical protein